MTLAYDEQKQWDFGVEAITKMGYDWERSRQDKTLHPFTTSFGWGDVRITTLVYPNYPPSTHPSRIITIAESCIPLAKNKPRSSLLS